jgi:hypothetical protein
MKNSKSKWVITHWGANMPPLPRRENIHRREAHLRQALIALALAGLLIGGAALAFVKTAEHARKEARP